MAWWESKSWHYFDAWQHPGATWVRVYSKGPVELTASSADAEYLDTREAFFGGIVRMFKWDGAQWRIVYA